MKGQWFLYLLIAVLIFFVTSICVAAPGKNKGSSNTNKQSLETSTRSKERAELRQQIKEEKGLGKEGDDSAEKDDEDEEKEEKEEKEKKEKKEKSEKSKDDNDSSDDSDDNSDDKEDNLSDEEPKPTKGKWWEFFKKSDK